MKVDPAERDRLILPDPTKAVLSETEEDGRTTAQRLDPLLNAVREHLHLPFRGAGIPVESYVAGGRYAWDELRRDRRNYRLTVWSTLSRQASGPEQADLWFALQNEGSGRRVWTRVIRNAFAPALARGDDRSAEQRVALAQQIGEDTMAAMVQDGIVLPVR